MEVTPRNWLLLRGLGREQRHWFEFPGVLERTLGVTCHTLDLPGVGSESSRSTPSSIDGIARDLSQRVMAIRGDDVRPWGVLGISLGGMIGMALCEYYPSWFSRLVLVNASSGLSPLSHRLRPEALLTLAAAVAIKDVNRREAALYRLATALKYRQALEYAGVAATIYESNPVRFRVFVKQLIAASRYHVPAELAQPVLVVSGRRDKMVSTRCSSSLAAHLLAEHVEHPTAGHDLPLEDPEWLVYKIEAWLRVRPRTLSAKPSSLSP